MENLERPIIVPWDFSQVAENAFQHAVNISRALNRDILLLHVVHDEKDKETKTSELEVNIEKLGNEYGKKIKHTMFNTTVLSEAIKLSPLSSVVGFCTAQ